MHPSTRLNERVLFGHELPSHVAPVPSAAPVAAPAHVPEAGAAPAASLPSVRMSARSLGLLAGVGLAALVGAIGAIYASTLSQQKTGVLPASAVEAFLTELSEGELRTSIELLHPRHRGAALKSVLALEKRLTAREVLRYLAEAAPAGRLSFVLGERRELAPDRWEIEVQWRHGDGRATRMRLPVREDQGAWHVDANPFDRIAAGPAPIIARAR